MIVNKKNLPKNKDDAGTVSINIKEKINMYDQHPTNVISLHEFHSVALNRLQVLRKIEFM
jgi:hypothetical protein